MKLSKSGERVLKTYEAVFILNERQLDDEGEKVTQDIVEHLTSLGGNIVKQTNMGRRQFAREIKKQKSGVYLDFIFKMDPDNVNLISQRYQLNPAVSRIGILLYEGPPIEA